MGMRAACVTCAARALLTQPGVLLLSAFDEKRGRNQNKTDEQFTVPELYKYGSYVHSGDSLVCVEEMKRHYCAWNY